MFNFSLANWRRRNRRLTNSSKSVVRWQAGKVVSWHGAKQFDILINRQNVVDRQLLWIWQKHRARGGLFSQVIFTSSSASSSPAPYYRTPSVFSMTGFAKSAWERGEKDGAESRPRERGFLPATLSTTTAMTFTLSEMNWSWTNGATDIYQSPRSTTPVSEICTRGQVNPNLYALRAFDFHLDAAFLRPGDNCRTL